MEAITNYIDNIFRGIPENQKTKQLRDDITANMSDKYDELKSEGKNDAEALGTVISEFGNIDELLCEMGIAKENEKNKEKTSHAKKYITLIKVHSMLKAFAFAVTLLILVCSMNFIMVNKTITSSELLVLFTAISLLYAAAIYTHNKIKNFSISETDTGEINQALAVRKTVYRKTNIAALIVELLFMLPALLFLLTIGESSTYIYSIAGLLVIITSFTLSMKILIKSEERLLKAAVGEIAEKESIKSITALLTPLFFSSAIFLDLEASNYYCSISSIIDVAVIIYVCVIIGIKIKETIDRR